MLEGGMHAKERARMHAISTMLALLASLPLSLLHGAALCCVCQACLPAYPL